MLLTRTLAMFLSRVNEIRSGGSNIFLVSGSLQRILNYLTMVFVTAKFCGSWVRMIGILLVFSVCDVCSAVSRSISWVRCLPVVTAESG